MDLEGTKSIKWAGFSSVAYGAVFGTETQKMRLFFNMFDVTHKQEIYPADFDKVYSALLLCSDVSRPDAPAEGASASAPDDLSVLLGLSSRGTVDSVSPAPLAAWGSTGCLRSTIPPARHACRLKSFPLGRARSPSCSRSGPRSRRSSPQDCWGDIEFDTDSTPSAGSGTSRLLRRCCCTPWRTRAARQSGPPLRSSRLPCTRTQQFRSCRASRVRK
jgi:hypothetical protein